MTVLQALLLALGTGIVGALLGMVLMAACALGGKCGDSRELYCTQLQLASAKELNILLIERIQEYEARDAEKTITSD